MEDNNFVNQYELEYLVAKTYEYTKNLVFDSTKHKKVVGELILALFDANRIKYERDYFLQNIENIFDDFKYNHGKMVDIIKSRHVYF